MSKIVKLMFIVLIASSCTSQPSKPWLSKENIKSVEANVVIGENLNSNFDVKLVEYSQNQYNEYRFGNCINIETPVPDYSLEKLVFFVFVKIPLCSAAHMVHEAGDESHSEPTLSPPPAEYIDHMSQMKSDIQNKLVGDLTEELAFYFPKSAVPADSYLKLNVKITNLYLHPKSERLDKFQLVATLRFCIMDKSEKIASYTNLAEAAGRFRSVSAWLELQPSSLDNEIKNIARLGAENIFKSLTLKPLSEVFYGDSMPQKC